ncbi:MAG: histidine kinase [Burkholderiales bacterium]|nr:histidine kinase [Burkholderiales bacterium]
MTSVTRRLPWLAYAAFWAGVGLFFSLAEWQHYMRGGGRHPWEPFLWEMSGAFTTALLAVAVYRWNDWLLAPGRGRATAVAGYLAGFVPYTLAHSALMFGSRYPVYRLAGLHYEPGSLLSVLGYEGAKDAVSYALVLGLSLGWRAFVRGQRQAAEVERLKAHLAEARLARLQEQVQPHFLFNTLNLISSVMHEDVERADRILAELADLLRQSMSAAAVAEHPLAQELRWVEPFLSIMRQRFGERLRSRIEVSDAAARCIVPALLLMAPVENAVKHGVARSAAVVDVQVAADVADGRLRIDIVDTGDAPLDDHAGGTGLANLRARLAALHGDAAEVTLAREAGRTRVRVTLPARREAAA